MAEVNNLRFYQEKMEILLSVGIPYYIGMQRFMNKLHSSEKPGSQYGLAPSLYAVKGLPNDKENLAFNLVCQLGPFLNYLHSI